MSDAKSELKKLTAFKDLEEATITEMLQELVRRSQAGEIETHDLIYVTNLLENSIIDAFRDGKITKEKMEKILYSVEDYHGQEHSTNDQAY